MPAGFTYGGATILSHPIFVEAILPFLLVFTIIFAVLQKSRVLGEGKRQIDAIVGLVVGLLVISFGQAVGIIIQLIPFLAVSLVIILVLMILIGMVNKEGDFDAAFPKGFRIVMSLIAIVAVIVAVLIITGAWDYLYDWIFLTGSNPSNILINFIFIVIIVVAVVAVLWGSKSGSKDK